MNIFHTVFHKRGFSLIEVAVALMVVGLGLTALLRMFPHSLRESQKAKDDSAQTIFSDFVFSALRARAEELSWNNPAKPNDNWLHATHAHLLKVDNNLTLVAGQPTPPPGDFKDLGVGSYLLELKRNPSGTIISATLWCTRLDVTVAGGSLEKKVDLLKQKTAYYSEFFYLGGNQ